MTAGGDARRGWDFFVSYTQADQAWAEWVAWVLEEDGYRVLVQAWDFVPGSNWIQGMHTGTRDAARTIAVLSPDYLESVYGSAEWQAAWASDPGGTGRKLLIVRVGPCERPGLLAGVVGVDLFGITEAEARTRLRAMVSAAVTGRAKPAVAPVFPDAGRAVPHEPSFPGIPPDMVETVLRFVHLVWAERNLRAAWPLVDGTFRQCWVQQWLYPMRAQARAEGFNLDDVIRAFRSPIPDHPLWEPFAQAQLRDLTSWGDLHMWKFPVNRRRVTDDVDLMVLVPTSPPEGAIPPGGSIEGTSVLVRQTSQGWRILNLSSDHVIPEPGWPPLLT